MEEPKEKSFSPNEAAVISESVGQSRKIIGEKIKSIHWTIKNINWLIAGIVVVLFISIVTMLLMVAGIVTETWRFNSSVYRESEQLRLQEENIKNTVEQQKLMVEILQNINSKIKK